MAHVLDQGLDHGAGHDEVVGVDVEKLILAVGVDPGGAGLLELTTDAVGGAVPGPAEDDGRRPRGTEGAQADRREVAHGLRRVGERRPVDRSVVRLRHAKAGGQQGALEPQERAAGPARVPEHETVDRRPPVARGRGQQRTGSHSHEDHGPRTHGAGQRHGLVDAVQPVGHPIGVGEVSGRVPGSGVGEAKGGDAGRRRLLARHLHRRQGVGRLPPERIAEHGDSAGASALRHVYPAVQRSLGRSEPCGDAGHPVALTHRSTLSSSTLRRRSRRADPETASRFSGDMVAPASAPCSLPRGPCPTDWLGRHGSATRILAPLGRPRSGGHHTACGSALGGARRGQLDVP